MPEVEEKQKRRVACKKCDSMHYNYESCAERAIEPLAEYPEWQPGQDGGTPIEGYMRRMEAIERKVNQIIDKINEDKLCQKQTQA